jgi:hypothetical protein
MRLSSDLREFLGLLNVAGVEYVVAGAHSLAFHGRPRYTGDLDILVGTHPHNAEKLVGVLEQFGFRGQFSPADFSKSGQVIQLGRAPHRIDLLTSLTGVRFEEATRTGVRATLDDVPVLMLGKAALIENKRAVGRPQDLADIDALEA